MHVHTGLVFGLAAYAWWFIIHTLVQLVAIQFHTTRFGQALAMFG
jgi:hypothetical protein